MHSRFTPCCVRGVQRITTLSSSRERVALFDYCSIANVSLQEKPLSNAFKIVPSSKDNLFKNFLDDCHSIETTCSIKIPQSKKKKKTRCFHLDTGFALNHNLPLSRGEQGLGRNRSSRCCCKFRVQLARIMILFIARSFDS